MLEALYVYLRGSIGFALIILGLGFFLEPQRPRVRAVFGLFFASCGFLFALSALDPLFRIPLDLGNFIIIAAILVLSLSVYDIGLYVLGGERRPASRKRTFAASIAWSGTIAVLPFLDYVFSLPHLAVSVEDARGLAFFHQIVDFGMYLLPLAVSVASARQGRYRLSDMPAKAKAVGALRIAAIIVSAILGMVVCALILSSQPLYRLGQTLLEAFMLLCYFYSVRNPGFFGKLRKEIHSGHERKSRLSETEVESIGRALEDLVVRERLFLSTALDLALLAKRLGLPAYRVSKYFNTHLETSFPVWLNRLRIDHICVQMIERPRETILDIALEAGYASKAVFNAQFSRLKGMSPSEYRKQHLSS